MAFSDTPNPASRTVNPSSLYDANGNPVTSANPVPVTISGGSSGMADNSTFTDGTSSVTPAGYIVDIVAGPALSENDVGAARMDLKRAQIFVGEDATTRGRLWTITSGGSLQVFLDSTTIASLVSQGTPYNIIMNPQIYAAANVANAQEFVTDSTGWNKISVSLAGFSGDTSESAVVSWSTTVNDQTAVKTVVDSITNAGKYATPDGSPILNTLVLPIKNSTPPFEVEIDPASPIKTIGVEITGPVGAKFRVLLNVLRAA